MTLLPPDGTLKQVASGDLIGRLPSAAVFLDDKRVSEAHALVCLRGADLKILSLRSRLFVDGTATTEAPLEEGMVIEPAPGLELTVAAVALPDVVPTLQGEQAQLATLRGARAEAEVPWAGCDRPVDDRHGAGWRCIDAGRWRWRVGDAALQNKAGTVLVAAIGDPRPAGFSTLIEEPDLGAWGQSCGPAVP